MRILYRSKARLVCLGVWVACWIRHLRAWLTRARNARCWMISCGSFVRASGDLHFFWTFVGRLIPFLFLIILEYSPNPRNFMHIIFISFQFIPILHLPHPICTLSFLYFLPGSRFFFTVRRFGYLVATLLHIIPTLSFIWFPHFLALSLPSFYEPSFMLHAPILPTETNIAMS